jgi:sugar O-acyltransferase (sialic acid O-acetyltransferase NeuD family)
MRQAVVLGTGGHCRVVLSLLAAIKTHTINQIIELGESRKGESIMGKLVTPTCNNISEFCGRVDVDFFLAIGDTNIRKTWWDRLLRLGISTPNLISPHAIVDETAELGQGNVICARAFIGPLAKIGNNNLINTCAILEHEVTVENHCHFAPASLVAGRSKIADLCFIGAGSTIIDNISISSGTTVGAGATVISNIDQAHSIVVGVPARERVVRH